MNQPTPNEAKKLLSFISSRPGYDDWIRIISAVGNTFDEGKALDILLSHFTDEKKDEHLKKLRNPLKDIGFGTIVHFAIQGGYKFECKRDYSIQRHQINEKKESKRLLFIDSPHSFLHRFPDAIEEKLSIMQYEGNISRNKAEQIILNEYPNVKRERTYRIAVNRAVKNKTNDFVKLNECFENCVLSIKEMANHIGAGHSIICATLKVNDNGKIIRKNESWLSSELIALDIDNKLTINAALNIPLTKHALMLYTSVSNTEKKNRFRVLFDLPFLETVKQKYREILLEFINLYGADKGCSDPARIYFGNSNATVHLLRIGKIFYYKNGMLNEKKCAD